jgi:hypothetical protein
LAFTTGYITNTRAVGTAASNVVVNIVNESQIFPTTVEVRIFYSIVSDTKIPLYVSMFTLPINSIKRSTFFIAGVLAYEVQFNVTSSAPSDVINSVYGLDESGNLVPAQRVHQSELSTISALSPTS